MTIDETRDRIRRSGAGAHDSAQGHLRRVRGSGRLKVALLAPPWIPVPPPGYGGIELVIAELAGGLVRRGVDVALLAPPGSQSNAQVVPLLERDHADEIGETLFDIDHVARALEVIDEAANRGRPFDIIHDHSGFALVAIADRVDVPVLHTMHGPFTPDTRAFYSRHGSKVWISGLTRAQLDTAPPGLQCVGAIPNPINVHAWRLMAEKERYLLWVGRMTPEKGPHRAIAVADQADRPLVIAGPIQPGQREFFDAEVAPHLDGEHVRYMEEVGGREKRELFAHAAALLMPIRWPEPFGMVMIEAMACGTPVLAFDEGAVPEVVVNGESGYIVKDEGEMAAAVRLLGELDPARCRACVTERFSAEVVSGAYEAAYRRVIAAERGESLDRHTRLRSMPDSG